ncbi:MAG: hypothetical protein H7Y36_10425 [Armatimonadetes bacterium]|nr:hypothetical protein [Akkermansiaceae bacterium]
MELCPYLPLPDQELADELAQLSWEAGGERFYYKALERAQRYWLDGKPAQAILQINKAFSAELCGDEQVLRDWPPPYSALVWILERSAEGSGGFLGNPVRHFQHLATRMSGARGEARSWRAWVCFYLARQVLDGKHFPLDGKQMAKEGIWVPGFERAEREVRKAGW